MKQIVLIIILLAFGLLALHYTQADGFEHHARWASQHGWPPPSFALYVAGLIASLLASAWIGLLIGRRGARPARRNE